MHIAKARNLFATVLFICGSSAVHAEFSDQIYNQGMDDVKTDTTQQEVDQFGQMQNDGQERGGRLQEYMDQTNETLQDEQPDQRELLNQQQAEQNLQQQRQIELNQQYQEGFKQPGAQPYQDAPNRPQDLQQQIRTNGGGRR